MIQHVVLLKVKLGIAPDRVDLLFRELASLQERLPGITAVNAGTNGSPEGKGQGYSHGFIVTFRDAAARDGYLPHPAHQQLATQYLRPIVDDVLVFDLETGTAQPDDRAATGGRASQ